MALNRRQNSFLRDYFCFLYAQVAATADATFKIFKPTRTMRIKAVRYINVTGLAQDASNYFNIKLMNGSTVIAHWSTLTGAQGSIAANTFVDFVLSSTDSDLVLAADDVLSLFCDETGDTTLPAGLLQVEAEYL